MPPADTASAPARPLGARRPLDIARDFATLLGAALTIGLAAGAGLVLTVLALA